MLHIFGKFLRKTRQIFETTTWLSFSIYLCIGFVIAVLLGQSFYRVFAGPNPDLDRSDPDVYPAIDVLHNPPLIARSDEMVKLEFNFVCRYVTKGGSCCNPEATLFVSYG